MTLLAANNVGIGHASLAAHLCKGCKGDSAEGLIENMLLLLVFQAGI